MPVIPGLAITIAAGTSYFRITDVSFRTAKTSLHQNVVNGQGARKSRHGARFNHPGATTVYLAENLEAASPSGCSTSTARCSPRWTTST